jgi:hypothetical protein
MDNVAHAIVCEIESVVAARQDSPPDELLEDRREIARRARSTMGVANDMKAIRAKADADNLPPRDLWMIECVQNDSANPQPCAPADVAKYPGGSLATSPQGATDEDTADLADAGCNPDFGGCKATGP